MRMSATSAAVSIWLASGSERGEYQYFAYPLPPLVDSLRTSLYRDLAPLARQWMEQLQIPANYPDELAEFLRMCHAAGQQRPTPLLLGYRAGDYNALHQDLCGTIVFPFQVICCLSQPEMEFTGGELLLVEQLSIGAARHWPPDPYRSGYWRGRDDHR